MRGTSGYATLYDPDFKGGHPKEADTFTCAHCNSIVHVKPRAPLEDMGGYCTVCSSLICLKCVGTGTCDPFEEKLKRMEARRSYG
jgi:DNA-directed RNA polymerase subunit RPC12/RpoP